ncbi:MAG TPA: LuxR C-terminal-related transcriptional regulator [Chitinophagaceae bacterium]|nr:LuxR C-terminal-related transcriptional regulator [Chitinophagaceae bacterium]
MQLRADTYQEYLDLIADSSSSKIQEESNLIIERFRAPQQIPTHFAPVTFLVDYSTKKYIYLEESCLSIIGHPDKYYYEEGIKGFWEQTHPTDFAIINEKIFPFNINFIKAIPHQKYPDFVFSLNFRMCKPSGESVTLLQRSSFVPGEMNGKPAGVIGVVFDITHFKSDHTIVHTIEETVPYNNEIVSNLVYKKTYPVYDILPSQRISKRELEILSHIASGLSSKQIADKLKLKINTVHNHRKNMLHKTNCKSSAELLSYAIKHGLL